MTLQKRSVRVYERHWGEKIRVIDRTGAGTGGKDGLTAVRHNVTTRVSNLPDPLPTLIEQGWRIREEGDVDLQSKHPMKRSKIVLRTSTT